MAYAQGSKSQGGENTWLWVGGLGVLGYLWYEGYLAQWFGTSTSSASATQGATTPTVTQVANGTAPSSPVTSTVPEHTTNRDISNLINSIQSASTTPTVNQVASPTTPTVSTIPYTPPGSPAPTGNPVQDAINNFNWASGNATPLPSSIMTIINNPSVLVPSSPSSPSSPVNVNSGAPTPTVSQIASPSAPSSGSAPSHTTTRMAPTSR